MLFILVEREVPKRKDVARQTSANPSHRPSPVLFSFRELKRPRCSVRLTSCVEVTEGAIAFLVAVASLFSQSHNVNAIYAISF